MEQNYNEKAKKTTKRLAEIDQLASSISYRDVPKLIYISINE